MNEEEFLHLNKMSNVGRNKDRLNVKLTQNDIHIQFIVWSVDRKLF